MAMSSTMTEHRGPPVEVNVGDWLNAVTFSANGEYLVSGGIGVGVWRVEDGKRTATMEAIHVRCLSVSQDGRWIAAGLFYGHTLVWDAKTYEQVFARQEDFHDINSVDFSPDSTLFVFSSKNHTASVWDFATPKHAQTLYHSHRVRAARYSPQGDRIATTTWDHVRVWNSNDGSLLVEINVKVTPWHNSGLLWFNEHLLVISDDAIRRFEASTGSAVSEWRVPDAHGSPQRIALPKHGGFIAYSAQRTVIFWSTSTHTQLGLIQHHQDVHSIALSPDDRFIAICAEDGKVTISSLSYTQVVDSSRPSRPPPTFDELDIQIDEATLHSWKYDQLESAEALLTKSQNQSHYELASLALVRTRLRQWDAAVVDATKSIEIQPSIIGYVAKSVALIGMGERRKAYRACDIAFGHSDSSHVYFLLLIKAIVVFMAGEGDDAILRIDDLISMTRSNSVCYVVQAWMLLTLGNSYMESGNYESAIQLFERARVQLRHCTSRLLSVISFISGWRFDDLGCTIMQSLCEALYAVGRVGEAGDTLLSIVYTVDNGVYATGPVTTWISDFLRRCLSTSEKGGDTNQLSSSPTLLLKAWAKAALKEGSWTDALASALDFTAPRITIYRALCDRLETTNHITGAVECFHRMNNELAGKTNRVDEGAKWDVEFMQRCAGKLESLGDNAVNVQQHDEAITQYSAALSFSPAIPQDVLMKRSGAYMSKGLWEDAVDDANQVIKLDPFSPRGYERKHAALHRAGRFKDAIDTFETMLLKISQSPDLEIRERRRKYLDPEQTKAAIRVAVQNAIRETPLMLINTDSGRLLDKSGQASSFESQPIFWELISSMTTHVDHIRIEHEVAQYYRYATFSHKWEANEPLFEQVVHIVLYDLKESPTHDKLKMFCNIVRDSGFHWAWSDTCCINKADHFVLQEALVAMFKWYEGSSVTIVLLRGVRSPSKRGDLVRNIWNTRAWTLQEYHASRVVRFYTEDWKPYLDLNVPNHKESPEIISEMEEATGVSAGTLMAVRPGLDDIRGKLRLASTRQTTRVEDAAYSLLGIFSMSLPVVYGEGDKALGRLLAQLLMSSGDTTILAWIGRSSSFNSCLPTNIIAFRQQPTVHIPLALESVEMDKITAGLRSSSFNATLVMELYDQLHGLPVPSFAGQRMKLPCIIFKLGPLSASQGSSGRTFRAQTASLGVVEIRTEEDLSRFSSLYLVHPWIDFLLDRHPVGSVTEILPAENTDNSYPLKDGSPVVSSLTLTASQTRAARFIARLGRPFSGPPQDAASLRPPSSLSPTERQTRALRVIVRLRQPFGALLLTPHLGNVAAYKRVATESLINVQVEEITPMILNKLIDSVRTLDVL